MAEINGKDRGFAVIFDMDEVIIDSNPAIIKTWNSFFSRYDIVLTEEHHKQYVFGRTAKDTLRMVFDRELSAEEIADHEDILHGDIAELYLQESSLVPGITEFVRSLAVHQIPIAIATSSPASNVEKVLNKADLIGQFNVISDASHALHSKPHPYIYLRTAERLGIDPSRCLVFEDSFSGITAAKAAGMQVIGLSTTHSAQELLAETDEVISDFTDIDVAHIAALMRELQNVAKVE